MRLADPNARIIRCGAPRPAAGEWRPIRGAYQPIYLHPSTVAGCKICRRNTSLLSPDQPKPVHRTIKRRVGIRRAFQARKIVLNPYKHAIFLHKAVIKSTLCSAKSALFSVSSNNKTKRFPMKSNLKVVLSAVALAALVAAPGRRQVAHPDQPSARPTTPRSRKATSSAPIPIPRAPEILRDGASS